jgi:hypothetical protein
MGGGRGGSGEGRRGVGVLGMRSAARTAKHPSRRAQFLECRTRLGFSDVDYGRSRDSGSRLADHSPDADIPDVYAGRPW